MKLLPSIVVLGWLAGVEAGAQTTPGARVPITREEVRQAIARQLQTKTGIGQTSWPRAGQVELPAAVSALAERSLAVTAVCRDQAPPRLRFRLECADSRQCMPFLAYVPEAGASAESNLPAVVSCDATGATANSAAQPSLTRRPSRTLVRAGERATVILVTTGLRVTTAVTCLDRGAAGDVIRVRNSDGRIFRARVSAPAQLQAVPQT